MMMTLISDFIHLASLSDLLKKFLADTALRANPIIGEALKRSPGLDPMLGVTLSRVVNISARCAFPFGHPLPPYD
jgi:hypothetical protein